MRPATPSDAIPSEGEPWGPRLWAVLAVVVTVTACLGSYGIRTWPMGDDEVPTLVEMGLLHVDASAFSVPGGQLDRLPRAMPVWYGSQRRALALLPATEFGFRLPSLICAILTSALAFLLAARWRGLWFAIALALIVNGSPMFVLLAQINRFYSLPLFLLTLTLAAMWTPRGGLAMAGVTAVLAALTALSHNITVAVFGLAAVASAAAYAAGRVPSRLVIRSGAAATVATALYLLYLRPIVHGWSSTGNPTPVHVSFAAHAGMAVLALACLGTWLAVTRRDNWGSTVWWALLFAGSLCFFPLAPMSWNPRYFVFFMPAMWVLAAHALEAVARGLGGRWSGAAWYGCVCLLLLPGLLSHFQDGSRHDYRQAASVLMAHARQGQPILSDDAETISYYLPAGWREGLQVRTKAREFPQGEWYLVTRANAWAPLPRFPGRRSDVLAEIGTRRYDQFSHVLRVYRITAGAN